MQRIKVLFLGAMLLVLANCSWLSVLKNEVNWRNQSKPDLTQINNYVTYYGPYYEKSVINDLNQYDMVVVGWMDRVQFIPKEPIVFQYLAVTEVGPSHRQYYDWLKDVDESYRLFDNPDYPGAWIIDIRKPEWQDLIINKAVPWTMDHGGNGLMLDTFGNISLHLGNSLEYRQAAVDLVARIRVAYPMLAILVNEPGDLLPDIYPYIDGIIFEQYMADIQTGELYNQPRSTWGNAEVNRAIQLRNSLPEDNSLLLLTCDMVKGNNVHESTVCVSRAVVDGMLPTLTPYSSLGKRYQKLPSGYLAIMQNQ